MLENARLLSVVCLAIAGVSGAASGADAPPKTAVDARLHLAACSLPGVAPPVRCGTYRVPEDRAHPAGPRIELKVVLLGATGGKATADPVVFFAGGPGEAATDSAGYLAGTHEQLRARHDFVLVDNRGTGGSAPIDCPMLEGKQGAQQVLDSFLPVAGVRACRAAQGRRDLAAYRTAAAVDDVAELLRDLGYGPANVWGVSYGTRSALELLRRHPAQVRTLALLGVVPPDDRMPLSVARDAQDALVATVHACAADAQCAAAFPHLDDDLRAAFARLDRAPATVQLGDPETGRSYPLRLDRMGFAQTLHYMLYVPSAAVRVPLTVHAAAEGDFQPAGEAADLFARLIGDTGTGFYLAATCAEDVPFIDESAVAAATAGTFLGDFRIRAQQAACREWSVPPVDRAELEPVRGDVPALLVSGERDPVTPVRGAEEVARTLPHALSVVVPGGGHGTEGMRNAECVERLFDAIVERGSETGIDTSCVRTMGPPPFALALAPPAIALTAEQRAALVGSYEAPGLAVVVEAVGDRLRLHFPGERPFLVAARSATRLELEGLPSSYAFEIAEQANGHVTTLRALGFTFDPVLLHRH